MKRPDAINHYVTLAEGDLSLARHLAAHPEFDERFLGFHLQQAAEKGIKARMLARDISPPRTHSLPALLSTLERIDEAAAAFWDLVDLTPYAVQFRYEVPEPSGPMHHRLLSSLVEELIAKARQAASDSA
ncbi:MAG: HEPN domain-containing protein [Candidatus Hydrogenedens sp.]|nr:HEPN domain-containing protein [Candidatus Hydrogenedens sp.]